MSRNFRNTGSQAIDQGEIANQKYNQAAGADKVMIVGGHMKPLQIGASSYTTDYTTARKVGKGVTMAFYNDTGATASITIGDSAITALTHGVTDANGNVGLPVPSKSWLYINTYHSEYVISSSATCFGYIIEDDTSISTRP